MYTYICQKMFCVKNSLTDGKLHLGVMQSQHFFTLSFGNQREMAHTSFNADVENNLCNQC